MKLYEFKSRAMLLLIRYKPQNSREKELKDILISRIDNLRSMTLPWLLRTLYEIVEHENVSKEFKDVCRKIVELASRLDFED